MNFVCCSLQPHRKACHAVLQPVGCNYILQLCRLDQFDLLDLHAAWHREPLLGQLPSLAQLPLVIFQGHLVLNKSLKAG